MKQATTRLVCSCTIGALFKNIYFSKIKHKSNSILEDFFYLISKIATLKENGRRKKIARKINICSTLK